MSEAQTPTVIHTYTLRGIDAVPLTIEVDIIRRLPTIAIVGVPASVTRELSELVRSAILAQGYEFPRARVVVNVSPPDMRKFHPFTLALPIALAILVASGQADGKVLKDRAPMGALRLDGMLQPDPRLVATATGMMRGDERAPLLPCGSAAKACAIMPKGAQVYGAISLRQAAEGGWEMASTHIGMDARKAWEEPPPGIHMNEVPLPDAVRDAYIAAVTSETPLLLVAPPGARATMLATRLATALPPMSWAERTTVARIYAAAGLDSTAPMRPFRAPHHTISTAGLIGNNMHTPSECHLAHGGVLYLDEPVEFPMVNLQAIAQVRTLGYTATLLANGDKVTIPAGFRLVMRVYPEQIGTERMQKIMALFTTLCVVSLRPDAV